jgi:hypothetical protein
MKDITAPILAILFVFMSLASLIAADPIPIGKRWGQDFGSEGIYELELRYATRR